MPITKSLREIVTYIGQSTSPEVQAFKKTLEKAQAQDFTELGRKKSGCAFHGEMRRLSFYPDESLPFIPNLNMTHANINLAKKDAYSNPHTAANLLRILKVVKDLVVNLIDFLRKYSNLKWEQGSDNAASLTTSDDYTLAFKQDESNLTHYAISKTNSANGFQSSYELRVAVPQLNPSDAVLQVKREDSKKGIRLNNSSVTLSNLDTNPELHLSYQYADREPEIATITPTVITPAPRNIKPSPPLESILEIVLSGDSSDIVSLKRSLSVAQHEQFNDLDGIRRMSFYPKSQLPILPRMKSSIERKRDALDKLDRIMGYNLARKPEEYKNPLFFSNVHRIFNGVKTLLINLINSLRNHHHFSHAFSLNQNDGMQTLTTNDDYKLAFSDNENSTEYKISKSKPNSNIYNYMNSTFHIKTPKLGQDETVTLTYDNNFSERKNVRRSIVTLHNSKTPKFDISYTNTAGQTKTASIERPISTRKAA